MREAFAVIIVLLFLFGLFLSGIRVGTSVRHSDADLIAHRCAEYDRYTGELIWLDTISKEQNP